MDPRKMLTLDQAAQMLGLRREQVVELCKLRKIAGEYLDTTGTWFIPHKAVIAYLGKTGQWQVIRQSLVHRALFFDTDPRPHAQVVSFLGRKSPIDVRLRTNPSEVGEAVRTFLPDCICIRIAPQEQQPFLGAVIVATKERPSKSILYHNLEKTRLAAMAAMQEQIKQLHVEFLINITPGIKPLIEAMKAELGIKEA